MRWSGRFTPEARLGHPEPGSSARWRDEVPFQPVRCSSIAGPVPSARVPPRAVPSFARARTGWLNYQRSRKLRLRWRHLIAGPGGMRSWRGDLLLIGRVVLLMSVATVYRGPGARKSVVLAVRRKEEQ